MCPLDPFVTFLITFVSLFPYKFLPYSMDEVGHSWCFVTQKELTFVSGQVVVSHRPSNQEEDKVKTSENFGHLEAAFYLQALVLMMDFNH